MLFKSLIILTLVALGQGQLDNEILSFGQFKAMFGKSYANPREELFRSRVYSERVNHIRSFNAQGHSFSLGVNEYSDLTDGEFDKMKGIPVENNTRWYHDLTIEIAPRQNAPDENDWRLERGAVTPVKNQRQCGSCAVFAGTGAIETANWKKTKKTEILSEQQIVDCWKPGYDTCGEGIWMEWGYDHVINAKGQNTEDCYPYEGKNGDCRIKEDCKVATVSKWHRTKSGDEEDLKNIVASVGPVAMAMDVADRNFNSYKRGVYKNPRCNNRRLGHAMLVVGYGREGSDDYWIVKNSWGATWGDRGYIKVERNNGNKCGIASRAVYPIA